MKDKGEFEGNAIEDWEKGGNQSFLFKRALWKL